MSTLISEFVKNIEDNIYCKKLIYRSILVTKNDNENLLLKNKLDIKDHSAIIIDNIYMEIDYNMIDNRIVIINQNKFKRFIDHLDQHNNGILNSSYNLIAFCYSIDNNIVEDLVSFYLTKTKNNLNNTIIMENNYQNLLYLKKSVT